jgi:hypothetical protein
MGEHVGKPLRLLPHAHRHGDGADAKHSKQHDGKWNAVAQKHCHTIAFADAGRLKPGSALLHGAFQLMVGQTLVAADNRLALSVACCCVPQKIVGVLRPLHETADDAIAVVPLMPRPRHATEPRPLEARHVLAPSGDRTAIDHEMSKASSAAGS